MGKGMRAIRYRALACVCVSNDVLASVYVCISQVRYKLKIEADACMCYVLRVSDSGH